MSTVQPPTPRTPMEDTPNNITITSWNTKGFSRAVPYLAHLMSSSDIMVIQEHHLYPCELNKIHSIDDQFDALCRSSARLDNISVYDRMGHGGIAILWRRTLSHCVQPQVNLCTDRICVTKLCPSNCLPIYIIGVYLPQRQCQIASFIDIVDELEHIIGVCQHDGVVIMIGDTNCHYGSEFSSRCWGTTTPNANYLLNMIHRRDMNIIDLETNVTGPSYTFYVEGIGQSYIDHCIIDCKITNHVQNVSIMPDEIGNTSDHLPIRLCIECCIPCVDGTVQQRVPKYSWHKMSGNDIIQYQNSVTDMCQSLNLAYNCENGILPVTCIDNYTKSLVSILKYVTIQYVPVVKQSKSLKPYWNQYLTSISREEKLAWHDWTNSGSPRDSDNPLSI